MKKNYWTMAALMLLIILFSTSQVFALNFPNKPITIIVPFSAGGGVDTTTRGLQPYLEQALGVSVVIENHGGAGGMIGENYFAENQKSDGYTILHTGIPAVNIRLARFPHQALNKPHDLIPIGAWITADGSAINLNPSLPYKTLDELITASKRNPIIMGIVGGTDRTFFSLLSEYTELEAVPVPFGGSGEALMAAAGGHVDATLAALTTSQIAMQDGHVKMLAISIDRRLEDVPDVPTVAEQGYKNVVIAMNVGSFVHRDTDPEIVEFLAKAYYEAATSQGFRDWVKRTGTPAGEPYDRVKFTSLYISEVARAQSLAEMIDKYVDF